METIWQAPRGERKRKGGEEGEETKFDPSFSFLFASSTSYAARTLSTHTAKLLAKGTAIFLRSQRCESGAVLQCHATSGGGGGEAADKNSRFFYTN